MSAGVCIMNKNGIALAADSALTVRGRGPQRIYNNGNKLFSVSKYQPIGAIEYNNAQFMGIPFEVIIKQFRIYIGNRKFETIEKCVSCFKDFLVKEPMLSQLAKYEKYFVERVAQDFIAGAGVDFNKLYGEAVEKNGSELKPEDLQSLLEQTVSISEQYVNALPELGTDIDISYIKNNYAEKIYEIIDNSFNFDLKTISNDIRLRLFNASIKIFEKRFDRAGYCGVLFAGYGEELLLPSACHFYIYGIINGVLISQPIEEINVTNEKSCAIIPLAQVDVMRIFITGLSDNILDAISKSIYSSIGEVIEKSCDEIQKKEIVRKCITSIKEKMALEFTQPVLSTVSAVPVQELTQFAEMLVSLTSMRRHVEDNMNLDTVGGPIDVSVITKSDGFIWINRKHYFDKELNPQYMFTHYNYGDKIVEKTKEEGDDEI